MHKSPFEVIVEINYKKDENDNYYDLLDELEISINNQPIDIKVQVYYILAAEYKYFEEFDKSFKYFIEVYDNRMYTPCHITENVILNLFKLIINDDKIISRIIISLFVKKEIPDNIIIYTTYISNTQFQKFLIDIIKNLNVSESSTFYKYFVEIKDFNNAVHFVNQTNIDRFIDLIMTYKHDTEKMKHLLINLHNEKGLKSPSLLLYLILHDNINRTTWITMLYKLSNHKYYALCFITKHSADYLREFISDLKFRKELDEEDLFYLYKNESFSKIVNYKIQKETNLIKNILYFSFFKMNLMDQAQNYYKELTSILFHVDEIEFLLSFNDTNNILNKINQLEKSEDYIKILEILFKKEKLSLLKESILTNITKYKDIKIFKVLVSYLLIFPVNINEYILNYYNKINNIESLNIKDRKWLYKVVYNNIVDDIKYKDSITYTNLLLKLLEPNMDTIYITLVVYREKGQDIQNIYKLFKEISQDILLEKNDILINILILFYEYSTKNINKIMEQEVFNMFDIPSLTNNQLETLVQISGNTHLVLECHNRNILTSETLERCVIMNSIKGCLYEYLRSIYSIDIRKYINRNIRIILDKEKSVVEIYGEYKISEFYSGLLDI